MEFSLTFINVFVTGLWLIAPVMFLLGLIIVVLGQIAGYLEGWSRFNAFYWSLVTAMTVGYGDIRPSHPASKLFSLMIAFCGLVMAGISVAIAIQAVTHAFEEHASEDKRLLIQQRFNPTAATDD
ncbi:MAG: potassium channel family protein [bacterium]